MLTADLVKPRLRLRGPELFIELVSTYDAHWLQTANDLITLFQQHLGHTHAEWHKALETYEGERLDYIVIRGLAKVLSDAATFSPLTTSLSPLQLREQAFAYGPAFATPHPSRSNTRDEVIQRIAQELDTLPEYIESALFADRPATYLLTDLGAEWTPEGLLARYNLELTRGVLYWASQVNIEVHDNTQDQGKSHTQDGPIHDDSTIEPISPYKDLWRYIKLFKLMFWAQPLPEGGYSIELDGPISPFVHATTRYGRQFAAFLPALLLCEQWRMVATVHAPQLQTSQYKLDHTLPLVSHFKRSGLFGLCQRI